MWDAEPKNTSISTPSPTANQLLKSTIIAATTALAIVVCVFLPAEHAIDPTGVGRLLGLTQMGEIRKKLVEYAAADASRALTNISYGGTLAAIERRLEQIERRLDSLDQSAKTAAPPPAQRQ
jgi:transcription elongation GreA/GreB family factor